MKPIFIIFRWAIFYLTILFLLLLIGGFISFSLFSLEFRSIQLRNELSLYLCFLIPVAFLLTLTGTLNKRNSKDKNWGVGGATILIAFATFIIMFSLLIKQFGVWKTKTILFRNEKNHNITISEQIWDVGAFGYDRNRIRIVKLKPVLKYFNQVKVIDTTQIDKTGWIFVKEEGEIQ